MRPYSALVVTRMGGICERPYRDSMARMLELGAQADAHLHDERVAVVRIIALQPQHPRVDVGHQGAATEDVSTETAMRPLRDTAIIADRREAGEQEAEHRVHASPLGMNGGLIPWRKQDRVGLAVAGAARPHPQWRVIDL